MIERLDRDGDGRVTRAEYEAPFDRMDTNKDGFIDQQEAQAAGQAMAAGFGGGQGGGLRGRRFGNGQMIMRLDRDGDGRVSRAEYGAPFERMDANRDGVVDQAEMAAVRERMQGRFGQRGGPNGPMLRPERGMGQPEPQ
ncbi:MAG: EF-hand domain-containing protein [Sphingomonas sp.]|nr:EF-hand domain-containing protein [Sphingomonas sp.]